MAIDEVGQGRDARMRRLRNSAETWLSNDDPSLAGGAMIETAFLMAAADGQLSESEYQQLCATIGYVTAGQVATDQIESMVAQLVEALQTDGWEGRITAVAQNLGDPTTRRNAYRLAAGVSFIDGEVQESEARLFALLAEAFEIPADEASKILAEVRDELFGEPDALRASEAENLRS